MVKQELLQLSRWNFWAGVLHVILFGGILCVYIILKAQGKTPYKLRVTDDRVQLPELPDSCKDKYVCSLKDCDLGGGKSFCNVLENFGPKSREDKLQDINSLINKRKEVATLQLVGLIVAFPAITALFHFVASRICAGQKIWFTDFPMSNYFEKNINPLRWIEYSITATIMIVAVAGLSGVLDTKLLWSITALMIALNIFGIAIEDQLSSANGSQWRILLYFSVAFFMNIVVFYPILSNFLQYLDQANTKPKAQKLARFYRSFFCKACDDSPGCSQCNAGLCVDTANRICNVPKTRPVADDEFGQIPGFVKAVIWGILVLYLVFPAILFVRWYRVSWQGGDVTASFLSSEKAFVVASFVAKAFLVIVVATGLLREDEITYLS